MPEIFVGGFPAETTEMQLVQLIINHGMVKTIQIVRDKKTGKSKRIAFIDMMDAAGAQNAVTELNGTSFSGQELTVKLAEEKPAKKPVGNTSWQRPSSNPRYEKVERQPQGGEVKKKRPRL